MEESVIHYVLQTPGQEKINCQICNSKMQCYYMMQYISLNTETNSFVIIDRFPERFIDFLKYNADQPNSLGIFSHTSRVCICLRCFLDISYWLHKDLEEGGTLIGAIEKRGNTADRVAFVFSSTRQVKSARNVPK